MKAMPTPTAIVRADKATKVYQRDSIPVPALHETSVEILEGDFVALVGPSGSGKTTLLNLIGGLDRPTSGRIWVGDQEITSLGRKALAEVRLRHIGFVFQEYNLVPVLSALENVEYVMLLQGVDETRRRQEALRLGQTYLHSLGITAWQDAIVRPETEERAYVAACVKALPAPQRQVVTDFALSENSMKETSRRARVPLQTAYARLYAGQRQLATTLRAIA